MRERRVILVPAPAACAVAAGDKLAAMSFLSMPRPLGRWWLLLLLLGGAGCSPVFNWREVPIGGDGVIALLPCKPDRATRAMPFGGVPTEVEMAGCQAGDATFAIARTPVADAAQARERMAAWRAATREQWSGATFEEAPSSLPRAAAAPSPIALRVRQPSAAGQNEQGRMLWFAHVARSGQVALYQATVLGEPSSPEAPATFFEGIRLP